MNIMDSLSEENKREKTLEQIGRVFNKRGNKISKKIKLSELNTHMKFEEIKEKKYEELVKEKVESIKSYGKYKKTKDYVEEEVKESEKEDNNMIESQRNTFRFMVFVYFVSLFLFLYIRQKRNAEKIEKEREEKRQREETRKQSYLFLDNKYK